MPQACQCIRDIWTMPLKICLSFWSALSDQDYMTTVSPFQLKLSILFYSVLCYAEILNIYVAF